MLMNIVFSLLVRSAIFAIYKFEACVPCIVHHPEQAIILDSVSFHINRRKQESIIAEFWDYGSKNARIKQ